MPEAENCKLAEYKRVMFPDEQCLTFSFLQSPTLAESKAQVTVSSFILKGPVWVQKPHLNLLKAKHQLITQVELGVAPSLD